MGQHNAPRSDARTGPRPTPGYVGRHREADRTTEHVEVAGSDVPPRGQGVTVDNAKGR